jgi:hypothetical protein
MLIGRPQVTGYDLQPSHPETQELIPCAAAVAQQAELEEGLFLSFLTGNLGNVPLSPVFYAPAIFSPVDFSVKQVEKDEPRTPTRGADPL